MQIGPYKILETLGEGGMGVVYLAQQTEPVTRQVALKIIKEGMDTKQVVARFEAERQALAVMDHPSIASIYDGGATESGRPYFVMELVRGVPITEYCDMHKLPVRERLKLFGPVCLAVQHAHQKGVIHRDLKPSNILITIADGKPMPKIIDFGIAKAVGQQLTEQTLHTVEGQLIGTPAYMSPEQAEMTGLDIDTRTDIYSLGVVLYELLVGDLPFDPKDLQGYAAIVTVCETDPPLPSSRFSGLGEQQTRIAELRQSDPVALRKRLKGDLDWIVMKAMEKDRIRRYETANGFALDIQRYLNTEPVLARAPSARYRTSKFVQRHKVGVAAGAAALVVLLLGSVAVSYLAIEATQARDEAQAAKTRAELRQVQAEDLISFMVGDLRSALEPVGRLDVLDGVGQQAMEYFAAVPAVELSDEELFRRSQALTQIGSVRMAQGNMPAARQAFDESLRLALDLDSRARENNEWQLGLGASHFWVGFASWRLGDLGRAEEQFQRYLAVAERNLGRDSTNLDWQLELGYAHSNIAFVLEARGDLDGALREFRRAMSVEQRLVDSDPENGDLLLDLANSHNTVGDILVARGEFAAAQEEFERELSIKAGLVSTDEANATWQQELAKSHNYLAGVLEVQGKLDAAAARFRDAVAILTGLVARDTANVAWRRALATNRARAGMLARKSDDPTRALRELRLVESMARDIAAQDPSDPRYQRDLASAQMRVGEVLLMQGDVRGALVRAQSAVTILEAVLASTKGDRDAQRLLSQGFVLLGLARSESGDDAQARAAWGSALEIIEPLARDSRDFRFLVPYAKTLVYLDRTGEAGSIIERLDAIGYVDPELSQVRAERGL